MSTILGKGTFYSGDVGGRVELGNGVDRVTGCACM